MGWSGTPEEIAAKRIAYYARPEVRERRKRWNRERYANDPTYAEKIKQKSRERYHSIPNGHTLARRARLYGITKDRLLEMLASEKCDMCHRITRTLVVDHCHQTDVVRGVLCYRCNTGLGFMETDRFLEMAQEYLGDS